MRLFTMRIKGTVLWKDVRKFGHWVESEASLAALEEGQDSIVIELNPFGSVDALRVGGARHAHDLERFSRLWSFFSGLGIRRVKLDRRLESNQIEDIVRLLYSYRRVLAGQIGKKHSRRVLAHLTSENGLHLACTQTSLVGGTLSVIYSYCTLRFSQLVHRFENAHRDFRDHRTLFFAAPRYSILVAVITFLPIAAFGLKLHSRPLLYIATAGALVFAAATYLFFMILGSVEFDNEEKAYRLSMAYGKLKKQSDRIHEDIQRAQIVQERFLPDLKDMPLAQDVEWAASFLPAENVGGDYFDVQHIGDGQAAIIFTDVSGHGMAAAFITAIVKTVFASWKEAHSGLFDLILQLNTALVRLTPANNFAALFAATYDAPSRTLVYLNCGHRPEPWVIPAAGDEPLYTLADARTLLLGFLEDIKIKMARRTLKPGDIVLFVSDGLIENQNVDGEYYGTAAFEKLIGSQRGSSVQQLVDSIVDEARRFSEGTLQNDDRTVLAFQVR